MINPVSIGPDPFFARYIFYVKFLMKITDGKFFVFFSDPEFKAIHTLNGDILTLDKPRAKQSLALCLCKNKCYLPLVFTSLDYKFYIFLKKIAGTLLLFKIHKLSFSSYYFKFHFLPFVLYINSLWMYVVWIIRIVHQTDTSDSDCQTVMSPFPSWPLNYSQ